MWQRVLHNSVYNSKANIAGGDKKLAEQDLQQFTRIEGLQPVLTQILQKSYQIFADRIFQALSNDLTYLFLDFVMGSGKTITALGMLLNTGGNIIIIGNKASKQAFEKDATALHIDQDRFIYLTVEKMIQFSEQYLSTIFKNSYVIIDEFQKLYIDGHLNQYGQMVQALYKNLKKYMKVICLSGTLFTQSAEEIKCIMQIFDETYENIEHAAKILGNHTISYIKQDEANIPEIIQMGEPLTPDFNVIQCRMSKEQYERYNDPAWAQEDTVLKTQQQIISPKYYYDGNKYPNDHIFKGSLMNVEALKNTSPLSYMFISSVLKILQDTKQRSRKIVLYLQNMKKNFGIDQYIQILQENGIIKYGTRGNSNTRCSRCGLPQSQHNSKSDHNFSAATYIEYTTDVSETKRAQLTNIFNSYQNRNGDQICIIILSRIAETGLSLSCVRHFFIMDDVNSIPSYQQIRARAVRYQSHIFLPQDERNVKVYIAVVAPPKGIQGLSRMEQNLKNKITNYKEIEHIYRIIRANSYDAEKLILPQGVYDKYKLQFLQYDVWLLQRFLTNFDVQIIPLNELLQIIKDQQLSNLDIDFRAFSDDFLRAIIMQQYKVYKLNGDENKLICQHVQQQINRTRVQLQPLRTDLFDGYQEIDFTIGRAQNNILLQISKTRNFGSMKNYIKVLMQTGQDIRDEFFKFEVVAAFMVYENAVYIEGDEENYTQNHYKLFQEIYGKTSDFVVQHIKTIVSKCKIIGYYQGNEIYTKSGKLNIKVISRQAENTNVMYFRVTSSLPQFKVIYGGYDYDCLAKQPIPFEEVFKDQKLIKQKEYQNMTATDKCKAILYYSLANNLFNTPSFIQMKK